jgi:hypothetical protein
MFRIAVTVIVVSLCGCASQTLKSYIGKDVRDIELEIGPPINTIDFDDGRRAFQWSVTSSYTSPVHAHTTTTTPAAIGGSPTLPATSTTTVTGGHTSLSTCLYTVFAVRDESKSAWIVVDFKKPSWDCE